MIAEIHNKISLTGSNLNDRLEDQLTGDFFGALRYIPFEKGLQKILGCNSVFPTNVGEYISSLHSNNEEVKYYFWKRLKDINNSTVEPDLIIEINDVVICIEVKYNSGLSSNDEKTDFDDESTDYDLIETLKESNNQLAREARSISREYKGKKLVLLFVARDQLCESVYNQTIKKINKDVAFARLSWSDIYDRVVELQTLYTGVEKIVIQDIIQLLEKKCFDRFKCIRLNHAETVIADDYFKFSYEPPLFEFKNSVDIQGDLSYEFRK